MGIKISLLPSITTPEMSDIFAVVQSGVTYKESMTQLSSLFATAGDNSNITSLSGLTGGIQGPTAIYDLNGNEMLGFNAISDSVNYIEITNASTGVNPLISSAGTDSNISIGLTSKGNAGVYFQCAVTGTGTTIQVDSGTELQHQTNMVFPDTEATRTYTWPDASGTIALTSGSGTVNSGLMNQIAYYATDGTAVSGVTGSGTGLPVLSTSPEITTPIIAQINDVDGNEILLLNPVVSAVNYVEISNSASEVGSPIISSAGADTDIPILIQSQGNAAVILQTSVPGDNVSLAINSGTEIQHNSHFVFPDTNATQTYSFPDASGTIALVGDSGPTVPPTEQVFLSGEGTYTTPAGVSYIKIQMVGGGGGGAGSGTTAATNGSIGNETTFGPLTCGPGGPGTYPDSGAGAGGVSSNSDESFFGFSVNGGSGSNPQIVDTVSTGTSFAIGSSAGGNSYFGGASGGGSTGNGLSNMYDAAPNSGSGGAGGTSAGTTLIHSGGGGGGAGAYIEVYKASPDATYSYSVGSGGNGGIAGGYGVNGGAGASGIIIVTEYYGEGIASPGVIDAGTPGQIAQYVGANEIGGRTLLAPTMQVFLSGEGTYTTPAGVLYLSIQMVGGGGGGAGGASIGGDGGTTAFDTLLQCTGGQGGLGLSQGVGGSFTITLPAYGFGINGANGNVGVSASTGSSPSSNPGASSAWGGAGSCTFTLNTGNAAVANSGSGGSGGAPLSPGNNSLNSGSAGAYLNAIIPSPSVIYTYSVGTGGIGGTSGPNDSAGGDGGSGQIIVTEYYQ